jgi:hypothetical protein
MAMSYVLIASDDPQKSAGWDKAIPRDGSDNIETTLRDALRGNRFWRTLCLG